MLECCNLLRHDKPNKKTTEKKKTSGNMSSSSLSAKYPDNSLCQKREEGPSATEVVPFVPRSLKAGNTRALCLVCLSPSIVGFPSPLLTVCFSFSLFISISFPVLQTESTVPTALHNPRFDKDVGFGAATKSASAKSCNGGRGGSSSLPAYLQICESLKMSAWN